MRMRAARPETNWKMDYSIGSDKDALINKCDKTDIFMQLINKIDLGENKLDANIGL